MTNLQRTALTAWHAENGAKLVEFAGYSMPLQYEGVVAEHRAVRRACGVFDVSHMAELRVTGSDARAEVNRLITNDVSKLEPGHAVYTALCNDAGMVLDDLLVYALADDDFMIVANACNRAKVTSWFAERLGTGASLRDESDETALVALQGPRSLDVLRAWPRLLSSTRAVEALEYYSCQRLQLDDMPLLLSRTGYTGEWGYELYLPAAHALALWEELLAAGASCGLKPCGLGARDTLRLEAGFSLYGHELDEDVTPFESGIGWVVRLRKGDFIGRDALLAQKEAGIPRRTIALGLSGRNIARQGARVLHEGAAVGVVTSGSFSPTLQHGIALARVSDRAAEARLQVDIRGKLADVEIQKPPFVPNRTRGES
ncbi:MAG TPA: glycine cleavage system aminomethyltransferase GcvT [Candidatus Krumholzibacteria bacterium]|jgi:aminomethyltransferase